MEQPQVNQTTVDGGGNTALIVIVILLLLVGGYFLFVRGGTTAPAADDNSGINVDIDLPEGGGSGASGTVEEGAPGGGPAM